MVSNGVQPMGISEGPYNGKPNPHARMSAENALIYVDNIRDALIKYDPDNAATYQNNAQNYKAKIQQTPRHCIQNWQSSLLINAGWSPAKAHSLI